MFVLLLSIFGVCALRVCISESFHLFHLPYVFDAIFTLKTDFQCKILHLLLQSIEHPSIPADSEKTYTHILFHMAEQLIPISIALQQYVRMHVFVCACVYACECVYLGDAEIRFSIPMFSHFK